MANGVDVFTQKTDSYNHTTLEYNPVVGQQLKPDAKGILRPVNQTQTNLDPKAQDKQYTALGVPREITVQHADGTHKLPVYIGQNGEGKAYAYFTEADQKGGLHTVQLKSDMSHAPIDNGVLPFPEAAQGVKADGTLAGPSGQDFGSKVGAAVKATSPGTYDFINNDLNAYGSAAKAVSDGVGGIMRGTADSLKRLVPGAMPHEQNAFDGGLNALLNPLNAVMHPSQTANMFAAMVHQVTHATPPPVAPSPQAINAYRASNSPAQPANRAAAYNSAHFSAPTPIASGGNNINKVLTQPVPTNTNGSVNADAAATKLVTGLGYGTGF